MLIDKALVSVLVVFSVAGIIVGVLAAVCIDYFRLSAGAAAFVMVMTVAVFLGVLVTTGRRAKRRGIRRQDGK